jgi:hypothetical protein
VAVFRLPAPRGGKRGTSALANPDSIHSVAVDVRVAAGGIAQRLIGKAINIRYTYGDEFVDQTRPAAIAIGPFTTYIAPMHIPEEFQISWETTDGAMHKAKVPVRSRLPGSIENKSVIFVIMPDHVEGYVGVSTPYGQKRERFY